MIVLSNPSIVQLRAGFLVHFCLVYSFISSLIVLTFNTQYACPPADSDEEETFLIVDNLVFDVTGLETSSFHFSLSQIFASFFFYPFHSYYTTEINTSASLYWNFRKEVTGSECTEPNQVAYEIEDETCSSVGDLDSEEGSLLTDDEGFSLSCVSLPSLFSLIRIVPYLFFR